MTGFTGEFLRMIPVLAAVAAVTALFPTRSVGFVAAERRASSPSAAFVMLSEDQEDAAVRVAKTAWLATGSRRGRGGDGFTLRRRRSRFLPASASVRPPSRVMKCFQSKPEKETCHDRQAGFRRVPRHRGAS